MFKNNTSDKKLRYKVNFKSITNLKDQLQIFFYY